MTDSQKRGATQVSPLTRLDRMLDDWFQTRFTRRPDGLFAGLAGEEVIRVDEYRDGDVQVVRAELPGVDPDKDVEVTVQDGVLRIAAERRVWKEDKDEGFTRREMRYGRFSRSLPLPDGATEADIQASYKDGILEIRVPVTESVTTAPTRVAITKS